MIPFLSDVKSARIVRRHHIYLNLFIVYKVFKYKAKNCHAGNFKGSNPDSLQKRRKLRSSMAYPVQHSIPTPTSAQIPGETAQWSRDRKAARSPNSCITADYWLVRRPNPSGPNTLQDQLTQMIPGAFMAGVSGLNCSKEKTRQCSG
jgi:hypothetical protein